mgnify:CR=1 FL=1
MGSLPRAALEDRSDPFWYRFWGKVWRPQGATGLALKTVVPASPEYVTEWLQRWDNLGPKMSCHSLDWTGAQTRDGYGRIISGVGGEMLAHWAAWSFYHLDPVPDGCSVTHAAWCRGGKLCMWPGCLILRPGRGKMGDERVQKIIRVYNRELEL